MIYERRCLKKNWGFDFVAAYFLQQFDKKNMRKFNHQHGAKIILFVFSINLIMHCAAKKLWKMMDHKSCLQQFDELYFLRNCNHIDTN